MSQTKVYTVDRINLISNEMKLNICAKDEKMNILFRWCLCVLLFVSIMQSASFGVVVDMRQDISSDLFTSAESGVWECPMQNAKFPFDEAIYSWNTSINNDEGFRLYIRLELEDKHQSPWLYGGFWGKVKPRPDDILTSFTSGGIDLDQILLKKKAQSYQFRVVSEGEKILTAPPSIHFIYTDNQTTTDTLKKFALKPQKGKSPILDIPFRAQNDSSGNYIKSTCQSAALGSAMEYFGKRINHEDIAPMIYDSEYNARGIWPRIIATAHHFGFKSYIDRFRDWDYVRATLAENKVILASITMPKDGDYIDPPYSSMGGHIIVLNGITDDGRVIVTDSALSIKNKGYRLQWLAPDFEKIWMKQKGGVGLVICPPKDAKLKEVKYLAPFKSYKKEAK